MLIDFHTHLDFYDSTELNNQLKEFSGTIIASSVDEKSFLKIKQDAPFATKETSEISSRWPSVWKASSPTTKQSFP